MLYRPHQLLPTATCVTFGGFQGCRPISQEKLAALADISGRNYQRTEAGDSLPELLTLFKICTALNLHYSDVIEPVFINFQKSNKK